MIRPFVQEDIDHVAEIWLETNLEAHSFIPAAYWRSAEPQVRRELARAEVYVCEEEGRIQGFLGLQGDYVAGLFVRTRSRGIGRLLLERGKEGRRSLTLHVYRKNRGAVRFYLREGFVIRGERLEEATGETEYEMAWEDTECV